MADGGHGGEVVAAEHGAHGAAVRVPAHDDVAHLERAQRVLDGGGLARGAVLRRIGRNDVARGAEFEELTGAGAGDQ